MRRFSWMQRGPLRDPDPNPGGGGFDPEAFSRTLKEEMAKMVNGAVTRFEKMIPKAKADPPNPDTDPDPDHKDKSKDAATRQLERQIKAMQDKLDAAEKARTEAEQRAAERERYGAIREALGKHQFATPDLLEDAFLRFEREVKRNEAGELVGPGDVPVTDYVASMYLKRKDWQPVKQSAGGGVGAGERGGGSSIQIEDIKPGMKAEDLHRAKQELRAALGGS